jgi:hypothetical protein
VQHADVKLLTTSVNHRASFVAAALIGALSTLAIGVAGLSSAPAASASGPSNWPLCGSLSLFSDDECDAMKYCWNHADDPACQQVGTQPSTVPPQQRTPQ